MPETKKATLPPVPDRSWYLGADVPGGPRVFMPYAGALTCSTHRSAALGVARSARSPGPAFGQCSR
jgi:hypothetical protein